MEDLVRWQCEDCLEKNTPRVIVNNFDGWYESVMDDWDTISRTLADFEREPEPENMRERLIREARRMKVNNEYRIVDAITQVAVSLRLMVDGLPAGRFNINVPEYEIKIEHEW